MDNFLWYDCETTGLNEYRNDIVQLACIPVINGIIQKPFNEFCAPENWNNIDQEAVDIHGITVERMKTFQSQEVLINKFITYLESFNTRFVTAGFNVGFDKKFLYATFKKHNKNDYFFRLFSLDIRDTFVRAKAIGKKHFQTEDLKLSTLCNKFNIEIVAHDAISDIEATIKLDEKISEILGESKVNYEPSNIEVETCTFPTMAHLHVHSHYSMLEGIPTIEEWIDLSLREGIPGLSITDHGQGVSLYRSIKFKEYIKDYNKKHDKNYDLDAVVGIPGLGIRFKFDLNDEDFFTLNVWAISNEGYFNIMKLSSLGYDNQLDINKQIIPILKFSDIIENRKGLVFSTACVNNCVGKYIREGNKEKAEEMLILLKDTFQDDLLIEFTPVDITHEFDSKLGFKKVQGNSLVTEGNLQKAYNLFLKEQVDKLNLNCIPTTSAFFIIQEDKMVQDCLQKNSHDDGKYFHESYCHKDTFSVYKELKIHLGEWLTEDRFLIWIKNTHKIKELAKSINIKFSYHLPKIDIPQYIQQKTEDYNKQTLIYLMDRIQYHSRWNNSEKYINRFKNELDVILKNEAMNFIPYFLMYEDLGNFARNQGYIQNIARGSAGGSLLSYYLKIIHVDPIKAELPFERFLSHARIRAGSWPDIDMDISKTARPILIKYLIEKYKCGFAQISTHLTMKTKNAIKDSVWAIYGRNRNDYEINSLCETIDDSPQGVAEKDFLYGYTDKEGNYHQGEIERNKQLSSFFENNRDIKWMVDKLIGTVRGWSRHASAFIISTLNLGEERLPMMKMYDKTIDQMINVCQYDAKMAEGSGLVKADILGLKTLSVVADAVKLIKESFDIDYLKEDNSGLALLYRLPEDEAIYKDFYNKKTDSSFQFNTGTVKSKLQDFKPTERKHNMALTALLRPGAMDCKMTGIEGCEHLSATDYYIEVRNGKRQAEYIHPDVEYIFKDSNAVACYQEEIMLFLVDIAGYSLEESDIIRGAIAKKKHDVIMSSFDRIRASTSKRGWTQKQQDAMCNMVMAFSRYSFNKSHSYAYAELGYITMYLKHYHPIEWWTAVLNNEDKEDKVRHFVSLLGGIIKPPSMRNPAIVYKNTKDSIKAPLISIKGVGDKCVEEMCSKGPFSSLDDFCNRINHSKVNIGAIGQMIKSRAADDLMNPDYPYIEAKKLFMDTYRKIRKSNSDFKLETYSINPIDIYMMEKQSNTVFSKTLLDDDNIVNFICNNYCNFVKIDKSGIPLMYKNISVITTSLANGLIEREYENDVVMILIFNSFEIKNIKSKKNNKKYTLTKINLSDGINEIEGNMWDNNKGVEFKENTITIVTGVIKKGFNTDISITIKEIKELGDKNDSI